MGFFDRFQRKIGDISEEKRAENIFSVAFIDVEVGKDDGKIHDIGATRHDGAVFHQNSRENLLAFLRGTQFVGGHNIVHHDAKYLFGKQKCPFTLVDTLYVSPLLFPEHPYHNLLKEEKLIPDQFNNPVADCQKARELFLDEVARWQQLSVEKQLIFSTLLRKKSEFDGFLRVVGANQAAPDVATLIYRVYEDKICKHANLKSLISQNSSALAYALAIIDTVKPNSITPAWVLQNYPEVDWIIKQLRHTPCAEPCNYCRHFLDVNRNLQNYFGYSQFRTYEGEPLQERAARAAVQGKSLLAIFPTGGGKSLTFQLPALMAGAAVHGLTIVISPLQSLMKDQVDNLRARGMVGAVTINGLLNPVERKDAIEQVLNGTASLLYIAPEGLRSRTIERILLARHVVRFVIDEAHCFSSWGQDFRVDYLYIGTFIAKYQKVKGLSVPIPVSCFTATAKQKVIQDICDYFKRELNLELLLFASQAQRTNLRYSVLYVEDEKDKYQRLRTLIAEANCPTIVYVSRTKLCKNLAEKLSGEGLTALPFYGKMEPDEKVANQEAFMNDTVPIIVATSAFGMGVDKKDVGLVVHYDISDSLENYVQEAGRAGRDPQLNARCYVLYSDSDLDKHFVLLNQTKLSVSEIQQVWRAVKILTRQRKSVNCSAFDIARIAGWNETVSDRETRVRTAIAALERSGYLKRGNNFPCIYATGITVKNMEDARRIISQSRLFDSSEVEKAARLIRSLLSQKYSKRGTDAEAEARVDYLADILGIEQREVVSLVERLRQIGILADSKDISAYLQSTGSAQNKSLTRFYNLQRLEIFLLSLLKEDKICTSSRQLNDAACKANIDTAREKDILTILHFLTSHNYIEKVNDNSSFWLRCKMADFETMQNRAEFRFEICKFVVETLYRMAQSVTPKSTAAPITERQPLPFSMVQLLKQFNSTPKFFGSREATLNDMEEALLYLSVIEAIKLDGGFLVLYNAMHIERMQDMRIQYKKEDYRQLDEYYKQKIQQIHIVGEYANLMVQDYDAALRFVRDYFQLDYKKFINQYFKGDKAKDIQQGITQKRYEQIYGQLSDVQNQILHDKESRCVIVAAGPGSGKTRVVVHKLASLLLNEDVKHEQLLMLTFARAAATNFRKRLFELIGNAVNFVEIQTFHSYCFNLLGRMGSLEESNDVVSTAATLIANNEVEPTKVAKTVLVIDEAQDMSQNEFALVKALMAHNENMRIIAVGDDDQNIFEFRGASSQHFFQLSQEPNSRLVEMTANYRSCQHIVDFANAFVLKISQRIKTTCCTAVNRSNGWVEVVCHDSEQLFLPLVNNLIQHHRPDQQIGVLTQTNEEAWILVALLAQFGIHAQLIQSLGTKYRFYNLAEIRYFLKKIEERKTPSGLISEENWQFASHELCQKYATSEMLPYVLRCIQVFDTYKRAKYVADFVEFVQESNMEDFCNIGDAEVVVSTIHKAKGREFDDVFMLVSQPKQLNDSWLRGMYVGITRAKQRLFIHTNSDIFNQLPADNIRYDAENYEVPARILLQFTLKDVYLDFCKARKLAIHQLRSGEPITFQMPYFFDGQHQPVAKISKEMQKMLKDWEANGYRVISAKVRSVVAWKSREATQEEEEWAILLPEIVLEKTSLQLQQPF